MDELDRFLKKYEADGYDFKDKEKDWGRLIVGTRARGGAGKGSITGFLGSALGLTHMILIGYFEAGAPSLDLFEKFLTDAAKLYKEYKPAHEFEEIVVLSAAKLEKRTYASAVREAPSDVTRLLSYQLLPGQKGPAAAAQVKAATPIPPPSEPSVSPTKLDYDAITRALPSPTARERILYAWEVLTGQESATGQYLVVTQERGVLMHKSGSDFVHDLSFRWESTGEPATEIDAGGPVLRIYDGTREHRLRNRDAQFIQVLIHHLKYAREGWISGHMRELGFDSELLDRCLGDFTAERYSVAVRNAFALLETRVRLESLAPRDKIGVDLATYAFHTESGRIPVGSSPAEREGVYLLFRGAFMAFRDPAAHSDQLSGMDRGGAFHQIALVDQLLKLTHRGKEQFQKGMQ